MSGISFRVPWGGAVRALFGLMVAGVTFANAVAQSPAPKITESILAAAHAGKSEEIGSLILQSYERAGSFDESIATEMLNSLVLGPDLRAFTVLLDELAKTNQGKNWQPTEVALSELVMQKRTEVLDALLARRLELKRLSAAGAKADPVTAAWIDRRVAEVTRERADKDALVKACAAGDLAVMKTLLDSGVDINGVSTDHWTPLTRAANKNQVEAVRLLLERGAAVDLPRHPGWDYTALCLTKSVAIAELLKAAGANVHARLFKRDVSILTYICRWGSPELVEWMIKQGVDPRMIGDNQQTMLFDAGDGRTVDLLLAAGVDPNHVDEFGRTALDSAKDAAVVEKLTAAMAKSPDAQPRSISKMIYGFATAAAIEAAIKKQGGLDPKDGQKALLGAVHLDQADVVRVLLTHGAKANEPGFLGENDTYPMLPLMMCAVHGAEKAAGVLLEYGADPNGEASFGGVLKIALRNGHGDLAKILRAAGAKGVSELALAIGTKDEEKVVELLKTAPGYAEQPTFWAEVMPSAARVGDLRAVQAALDKGVPEKPANEEGGIQAAAFEGQFEVLQVLLARRAKTDAPTDLYEALHNAVWNSHPYDTQARRDETFVTCVDLLLKAGVLPNSKDGVDSLVSVAVFTRNPGGNPKVVELLVAAGADPNPFVGENLRLKDYMEKMCETRGCGTPLVKTIEAVEKLAKVTIKH